MQKKELSVRIFKMFTAIMPSYLNGGHDCMLLF